MGGTISEDCRCVQRVVSSFLGAEADNSHEPLFDVNSIANEDATYLRTHYIQTNGGKFSTQINHTKYFEITRLLVQPLIDRMRPDC